MNKRAAVFRLAMALVIGLPHIASADDLANQLRTCAATADDPHRLACYDRVAANLRPSAAKAPSSPVAAAGPSVAKPDPATEKAEFGVDNGPLAAQRQSTALQSISAAVVKIVVLPYNQLMVTLDNGQVWKQIHGVDYFPLKVGDSVEIDVGALGSYILQGPSKRTTKVTRIR